MNMALQKFAHGATHYCKFKRTALCENALHYDNKTTLNKQILCSFQKKFFFQRSKNWHTPSIFRCSAPCQVDLWAETVPFSVVLPLENTQNFIGCYCAAPKVLWENVISRRSKELKSDPRSCPLVWAPCWKFESQSQPSRGLLHQEFRPGISAEDLVDGSNGRLVSFLTSIHGSCIE